MSRAKLEQLQQEITRLVEDLVALHQERGREIGSFAEATSSANVADGEAERAKDAAVAQAKRAEAERHRETAARHQRNVTEIEAKIGPKQARMDEAQKELTEAAAQETKRVMEEAERKALEHEMRMKDIADKLAKHEQLHQLALSAIEKLQQLPEQITVLFLAANPVDEQQLRLDEEVRSIAEMVRKSAHRDSVRLESRWAVRPLDVLQAINECQPRVVHFIGHGSDRDEIVFQDSSGRAKPVSKEAIVQTMAAGSDDIQLVFFNSCYSRGQAEAVVQHVPAAIGMNDSIGDDAARVFSAQFYSALGFGHSVARAFQQAKAALLLEGIPEDTTPELFVTAGFSADDLVLVQPGD